MQSKNNAARARRSGERRAESMLDTSRLIDLNTVQIDGTAPPAERVAQYVSAVKDPYFVRVGDTAVHITFKRDSPSLQDALVGLIGKG